MSNPHPCRACAEWLGDAPVSGEHDRGYCLEWRIRSEPEDGCRRWRKRE